MQSLQLNAERQRGLGMSSARTQARSRLIELDGELDGPVHYVDYGGEGPPMLLVHGLGGSHLNWAAVAPSLARRYRVVALDLAGFGHTPLGKRSSTLETNAGLIARFIERVFGEPVTLVGNSMGGLLGKMVAAEYPHTVQALVLVDASQAITPGAALDRQVLLAFAALMLPGAAAVLHARDILISAKTLVRMAMRLCCVNPAALDPAVFDAHVAFLEEQRLMPWRHTAFLSAARSTVRAVLTPGRIRRIAERVTAPTLVIHGDGDRLIPLAAAKAAARRRGWALKVFEGIGHVPQLECPDRFVATVNAWLEGVLGASTLRGASRVPSDTMQ